MVRSYSMAVRWRVNELATRKGWGARQLAEKAGIDVKTARNILTGRAARVDLRTISRLAQALDVAPGALWRTVDARRTVDAWKATAGAAGIATEEEIDRLLRAESDAPDPGLERAARAL